jgi:Ca2+-binding EF-hand superfamily protein
MTEEDIDKLFAMFPRNEEGKFNYKEFISLNK